MATLWHAFEGRLSMFVFYPAGRWSARNVRVQRRAMGFGRFEREEILTAYLLPFANQLHIHLAFWRGDMARDGEYLVIV